MAVKKPAAAQPVAVEVVYFPSPAAFRAWLEEHHRAAAELWVGFHKRGSGRPSLTWPESVDEALCFGWIDGVRKRVDEGRYKIRFSPRRAASIWSAINVARVAELQAAGRMSAAGLEAFERRREDRTRRYAYEQQGSQLAPEHERQFRRDRAAWKFYVAQPPWYQRTTAWWVTSAKREETRQRRLATLVASAARGEWIDGLARPKSPAKKR